MPTEEMTDGLALEKAGFLQRAMAFGVDCLVVTTLAAVPASIVPIASVAFGREFEARVIAAWTGESLSSVLEGLSETPTLAADWEVSAFQGIMYTAMVILSMLYFVTMWRRSGVTAGNRIVGIRVVSIDGGCVSTHKAVIRYLAYWFNVLFLGLGFLSAVVDRDKQAAHDRIADTYVVRTR